ncbi:MAG: hypothetical protein MJZ90_06135 [Bacteroidales bacterium]|nr:hypothetical protein [Bacteroidales bacterium]
MATTKKTATKKTDEKRNLTAKEYDEFFGYIEKARRMAFRLSEDKELSSDGKKAFKSIEKKLENVHNDYLWGRITNYVRP